MVSSHPWPQRETVCAAPSRPATKTSPRTAQNQKLDGKRRAKRNIDLLPLIPWSTGAQERRRIAESAPDTAYQSTPAGGARFRKIGAPLIRAGGTLVVACARSRNCTGSNCSAARV